jgi:oligopeptide transport system substrate-binding protein
MHWVKKCALWASAIAVLLSSCQKAEESSKQAPQVLRMNINREPPTLDPRRGSELIGSAMHFILFEGLMRLHPDGSVYPAQAKSVEISDDRKTYTFHIRDTVWSDGSPVTAQDFELAWKKVLSPTFPSANAHLFYPIKNAELAKKGAVPLSDVGIHSLNDKTLQVVLENPAPYFLDLVSFCVFYPVCHTVDEQNPEWFFEAGPQFLSNGPFKLASWKHNNEIVFERNPLYWEANQISFDKIHVSMVSDENTALKMFENDELDIIGDSVSRLPNEVVPELYKQGALHVLDSPGTTVVWFNNSRFPFNNKNIRKAFAYAINRKEIVENITQLGEEIATNIIPPMLKNNVQTAYFKDNDVELAAALLKKGLKELGISAKEFPEVVFSYSTSDANHKLAQALQNQWAKALGVKVVLQNSEHKILLDKLSTRSYDIAQSYWVAQYNDPLNIFDRFKLKKNVKNYPDWENAEYARLLDASALAVTPEDRMENFDAAEAVFMEEMPLAPIYHWKSAFMVKSHISNFKSSPKAPFDYTRLCCNDPLRKEDGNR